MKEKWIHTVLFFTVFIIIGFVTFSPLHAEEISPQSKIDAVTVFPGRALVERKLKATLSPGRQTIVFSNLPQNLDSRSVRVTGKGTAIAKILDVQVKHNYIKLRVDKSKQQLMKDKMTVIDNKIQAINDTVSILEKKEKYLTELMESTLDSIANAKAPQNVPLEEYKKMPDFLEQKLEKLYRSKRELAETKETLTAEKNILKTQLDINPNVNTKEEKKAYIEVDVKNEGYLILNLAYMIPDASWSSSYDLRVFSNKTGNVLTHLATVKQHTGEDWKNVRLTLSTARPLQKKKISVLEPVFLDLVGFDKGVIAGQIFMDDGSAMPGVTVTISSSVIRQRSTVSNDRGKYQFTNLPPGDYTVEARLEGFKPCIRKGILVYSGKLSQLDILLSVSTLRQEVVVSGKAPTVDLRKTSSALLQPDELMEALNETTEMRSGTLSTTYSLKYRNTIMSGTEGKKVTIAALMIPVMQKLLAVPLHGSEVYLQATVENSLKTPFPAGPVNIFYDGMFINSDQFWFLNPGQTVKMALGVDPSITVERSLIQKESETKGVFNKRKKIPMGYQITVKNMKNTMAEVFVQDQLPISKNKKVSVLVNEMTPKPLEAANEKTGLITWRLSVNPGTEKTIRVKYVITHPNKNQLEQWHGDIK